jgi:hypothetical protein
MASRKSQHFVPKAHLKPFSTNGDRKSISLFNIKSEQLIDNAGIKHQCARNYFYGKDDTLEKMLGEIEGEYAMAVRNAETRSFTAGDLSWMRLFMAVQYGRTEAAVQQMKEFAEKSGAILFRGMSLPENERFPLDPHQLVIQAMKQMRALTPYMKDLDFCIFQNRTPRPFITSDNPLINTNRFYCQKLEEDSWGAMSAGALFLLPLGPRLLACFYDAGVYSVKNHDGYVEVPKKADVLAFNEMQYLSAAENIYFSDPADGQRIASEFKGVRDRRVKELASLTEFLAVEMPDGTDRLVRRKPGMDEKQFQSKYVMYRVPRPKPARWPSVLGFRMKPVAYSNGSASGHVGHEKWLRGDRPE